MIEQKIHVMRSISPDHRVVTRVYGEALKHFGFESSGPYLVKTGLIERSGHLFLCSFEMALLIQSLNMSLEIFVCAVCRFVAHNLRKEGSGTKHKKWFGGNEVLIRLDGCNRHR